MLWAERKEQANTSITKLNTAASKCYRHDSSRHWKQSSWLSPRPHQKVSGPQQGATRLARPMLRSHYSTQSQNFRTCSVKRNPTVTSTATNTSRLAVVVRLQAAMWRRNPTRPSPLTAMYCPLKHWRFLGARWREVGFRIA